MITKLDRAVIRYLRVLGRPKPPHKDERAWMQLMDELDHTRFAVLDVLLRKGRYSRLKGQAQTGRKLWRTRSNLHRPPA